METVVNVTDPGAHIRRMIMNKIVLTKSCRLLAEFFADARCPDNSLYKKRGGFKRQDIVAGALGEIASFLWLQERGYDVSNPDFSIHNKKSFGADLVSETHSFHIKSQTIESAEKYGDSWILQRTDRLVSSPEKGHYLILCNVDIENLEVHVKACVSGIKLADNSVWGECKLNWFRESKVALYLEDIKEKLGRAYALRSKNDNTN